MRNTIKDIVNRGKQGFEPPIDKWILNKKYEKDLNKGLKIIKEIDKELHIFYFNKIFKEKKNFLYNIYKIRLFLFEKWRERCM